MVKNYSRNDSVLQGTQLDLKAWGEFVLFILFMRDKIDVYIYFISIIYEG